MDSFDRRKHAPLWWLNKSSDLRASAGALFLSMDEKQSDFIVEKLGLATGFCMSVAVWPVYLMLCGMSLELLYKAISVAKGDQVQTNHDLIDLAHVAGVETDEKTKTILQLLTESVIWEGKYPVPKDKHKESFYTANRLYNEVMYTKYRFHGCEAQKPTHALNWESFNEIWLEANKIFWEKHS